MLISAPVLAGGPQLRGTPTVILGDILEVQGKRVRLLGIDAPERGQKCLAGSGKIFDCGHIAVTALMDLTAGVNVSCTLTGIYVNNLPTALCKAGGYDLSKGMVHAGWAFALPGQPTEYSKIEKTAQNGRHGMWRGKFDRPWDWRKGVRAVTKEPRAATR